MVKSFIFFTLAALFIGRAEALSLQDAETLFRDGRIFPSIYFTDTVNSLRRAEQTRPYWVNTPEEAAGIKQLVENQNSILLNNDIIAYYGHPHSRNMGILGRHSIEELDRLLSETAAKYDEVNGERGVQKAFYIIYGTVWPQGNIGIINHDSLMRYIEYGMENDILVFIDHQIGRFDPIDSLKVMLPYLHYPNVHLALDPEWRTQRPMREFGHLTGEEVNLAQQIIEEYLIEHNLPGERMFVIHQFHTAMLRNREEIRSDFNRVRVIHCMDGIGSPALKRNSYAYVARAANMPIKGFKLFYNFNIPGAGFDEPIMTPQQVYALNPSPMVIMYQ